MRNIFSLGKKLTPKMKPLQILYEDNHLIAVVKPSGILTQSDITQKQCLMDQVKIYLKEKNNKPGNVFLGLLHRLDRNVEGIVLLAKTSKGASRLSKQFRDHTIEKTYEAIVDGILIKDNVTLTHHIAKDTEQKRAIISDTPFQSSKECKLSYKIIEEKNNTTSLRIKLHTGRFHQIRAQFAFIGHPIIGDTKYGSQQMSSSNSCEIKLRATELSFTTTTGEKRITIGY